jgi:hypothetical protein
MGWFLEAIANKGIVAPAKPVFMGSTPIRCSSHSYASHGDPVSPDDYADRCPGAFPRLKVASGNQPRLRKENLPGRIEVHPALRTEPAGR